MRDLLVITPSRGRPGRLAEMLDAVHATIEADTKVVLGLDDDDPEAEGYGRVVLGNPHVWCYHGPRRGLTAWTNNIASACGAEARAFASLGDDHLPRTRGWDTLLLAAIDKMGGTGIAYGNDLIFSQGLPTAPVISADIVAALGWMCEPSLDHMCVDLVWKDLGLGAGCLAYVPEVIIEHVHPCIGKAAWDQTYAASEAGKDADNARYETWRAERMERDVAKVRALIEGKAV